MLVGVVVESLLKDVEFVKETHELNEDDIKALFETLQRTEEREKLKGLIEDAIRVMRERGYKGFKIPYFRIVDRFNVTAYDIDLVTKEINEEVKGVRVVFEDGLVRGWRL